MFTKYTTKQGVARNILTMCQPYIIYIYNFQNNYLQQGPSTYLPSIRVGRRASVGVVPSYRRGEGELVGQSGRLTWEVDLRLAAPSAAAACAVGSSGPSCYSEAKRNISLTNYFYANI